MKLTKLSEARSRWLQTARIAPLSTALIAALGSPGARVADPVGIRIPDNETIVEIPRNLLKRLIKAGELA